MNLRRCVLRSAWPERFGECIWYLPWRFHRSATAIGGWHLLHKVALETWSCLFTFHQGTDSWEIKKYHTKTGEDGETWGVSHCYGAAVRRRIIEVQLEIPTGEAKHYIPHQPVIRDQAKSTKTNSGVSLNDCLEVGPPLQPMIFDILQRNRPRFFYYWGHPKGFSSN